MDAQALFYHVQALPDEKREGEHAASLAEVARRRRVEARDASADALALVDPAELLGDAAGDAGRREFLHATAGRARAAVVATRDALAATRN